MIVQYGMVIRNKDVDIVTHPTDTHQSRITCDICESRIPDVNSHYHCGICRGGDFDICQKCTTNHNFCLDYSHKLFKRTVKDGALTEVPD
jgi:hypothetical protein